MDHVQTYVHCIQTAYPNLLIGTVRMQNTGGQFNDILIVNETILFRFPRSPAVAAAVARAVSILRRVQPYLTLPVPNPVFTNWDLHRCGHVFMGYWMLPGTPFWPEILDSLDDEDTLNRLAQQLATFLRALHGVPVEALALDLPVSDDRDYWAQMYAAFRDQLFPYMRADARDWVTSNFETFLNAPRHFSYTPVLRHGDFGGSNILYDTANQMISGVIDFDSVGMGDPAVDVGPISGMGESFLRRMYASYPEIEAMVERAEFYKSTYALQQALYALRDHDQASFEDGIAQYT